MINVNYYIIGNIADNHSQNTYWNSLIGWTKEFNMAHSYDIEIMDYPLPIGATGIMQINSDTGKVLEFFPCNLNNNL